jgi:hypothetical protein
MNILSIRRHRLWSELASAFADGSIDPSRREAFSQHLVGCDRCRAAVAETRGLRAALREMPEPAAPRSFRLTPAMLAATDPLETRRPARALRAANLGARVAAGVAAMALAAVFVIDLGFRDGGTDQASRLAGENAGMAEIGVAASEGPPVEASATDTASGALAPEASPAPDGTPFGDEKSAPENRQAAGGEGADEAAGSTLGFAASEPGGDSDEALIRGLEIGLGAALAGALVAMAVLHWRGRRAGGAGP